ncbi:hypothetical protein EWM64_g9860 [Hericium alpestre]|uniref:Uncharacterized protein n=1 Tax=Hericium alpestre TaxID=135208 RepID=A0A4Y9ZJT9_9AGAM|nr:hypothetical protein EWM64_g9860 [Hericium alpestre]
MFKENKTLSSSPPAFAAVQPPLAPSLLAAPPVMSTFHKGGARNLTRKVVRTVKRILNKLRPRRRKGKKKGELDTSEPIAFAAAISVSVSIASLSEDTTPTGDVLTPSGSTLDDSALLFLAASISISGHDDFTPSLIVSRQYSPSAFYPQSLPATLPMLPSCLPMPKDAHILTFTADSVLAPDPAHCHEEEPLPTQGKLTAPSLDLLCSVDLDNGDLYHLDIDISSEQPTKPSSGQSTSEVVGSALPPALGNFVSGSSSGQPTAEGSDRSSRSCTSVGLEYLAPAPFSSSQAQLRDFPSFSHLFSISELINDEQSFASPSPAFAVDADCSFASEPHLLATTIQAIQSSAGAQSNHPYNADDMAPCVSVGSFLCMAEAPEFLSVRTTATEAIQSSAKAQPWTPTAWPTVLP